MSLIQMSFFSKALNMYTGANVILPLPQDPSVPVRELPVLYLLHGMSDDCTAWQRKTAVERYALEHNLAVVMPNGGMSSWENMAHGGRYRDFVLDELPETMRGMFPLSAAREKNFIAGCSMGAFGALKLALARPEAYAAVGCFSGSHFEYRSENPINRAMLARVYDDGQIDAADARTAADARAAAAGNLPLRIYAACGDRDLLRENAEKSRDFLQSLGGSLEVRFEMLPGRHDWMLWDESLRRFIEFLDLIPPQNPVF